MLGQVQNRIAQQAGHARLRRDEIGRTGRVHDILVRAVDAFIIVAVQQAVGRLTVDHQSQFPAKVIDVLHARVRAPCAERRNLMGRVASKEYAPVAEAFHALALEGIDRGPDHIVFDAAKECVQTTTDIFLFQFFLAIDIPTDLKIDAPDIIWLFVQQGGIAFAMRGLEPEPAFGREFHIALHLDVSDQEAVLKHLAGEVIAQHFAQGRRGTVTADQPVCFQFIRAIWGRDFQNHVVVLDLDIVDAVLAADFNRCTLGLQLAQALDLEAFVVRLLQVDKGRILVSFLGQKIEFKDFVIFVEHFAQVPHDAFVQHRFTATITVCDLEAALGETNGARSHTDAFVVVQHQHGNALQAKIQCGRNTDGTATHHDNRMAHSLGFFLIGRFFIGVQPVCQRVTVVKHVVLLRNFGRNYQWP